MSPGRAGRWARRTLAMLIVMLLHAHGRLVVGGGRIERPVEIEVEAGAGAEAEAEAEEVVYYEPVLLETETDEPDPAAELREPKLAEPLLVQADAEPLLPQAPPQARRSGVEHDDAEITTVAFGSCNKVEWPQPLWDPILALKPELFIWMGDNVYADEKLSKGVWRWRGAEVTTALYTQQRQVPGYKRLIQSAKVIGTYDDHDFGENNAGKEFAHKNETQALLLDFLGTPAEHPLRQQQGLYRAYTFGPPGRRLRVLMLDTRFHRDPIGSDGEMLGEAQWSWLEEQLTMDTADITLIVSSIQVLSNHIPFFAHLIEPEGWAQFPTERRRLFALLQRTKVGGVMFLSGDVHFAEITRAQPGCILPYPTIDITSSGMTHSVLGLLNKLPFQWMNLLHWLRPVMPDFMDMVWPWRYRQPRFIQLNFGGIHLDWEKRDVCVHIYGEGGTPRLGHCIHIRDLQVDAPGSALECPELTEPGGYYGEHDLPFRDAAFTPVAVGLIVMISYAVPIALAGLLMLLMSSCVATLASPVVFDYSSKTHVN